MSAESAWVALATILGKELQPKQKSQPLSIEEIEQTLKDIEDYKSKLRENITHIEAWPPSCSLLAFCNSALSDSSYNSVVLKRSR